MKQTIKIGQVWKQKGNEMAVIITGKNGGRFKAKVLSGKIGVYRGSHTMTPQTIKARFELITE